MNEAFRNEYLVQIQLDVFKHQQYLYYVQENEFITIIFTEAVRDCGQSRRRRKYYMNLPSIIFSYMCLYICVSIYIYFFLMPKLIF